MKKLQRMSELVPEISYAGVHQLFVLKEGQEQEKEKGRQNTCEKHVENWMEARLLGLQLDSNTTTIVERIYTHDYKRCGLEVLPLNEPAGRSETMQTTVGGLHIAKKQTHFVRQIHDWGEVFHSKAIECDPSHTDAMYTYRSRKLTPSQNERCNVIHIPEILAWAERILAERVKTGHSHANETVMSMLTRRRIREEARQILSSKQEFCVLITLTTFQPFYAVDALIRHALLRLLTKKYKPCLSFNGWKGGFDNDKNPNKVTLEKSHPQDTYKVLHPFKFVITMPNEMSEGYLVEKTVHPYLAGSLAITAVPDVGKYINAESMISCQVPSEDISKVQAYYRGDFSWMPFDTMPDVWPNNSTIKPIKFDPYANNGKGDEPVLEFVSSAWEDALQPCVERIRKLDMDDDLYIEKLMQPYILNDGVNSMFDGTYVAHSLLQWFSSAHSPLVEGVNLDGLPGMSEQTPGWGLP